MDKEIQDQLNEYLADFAKLEEEFEKYASFITKELKELGLEFEIKKPCGRLKDYLWKIQSHQSCIALSYYSSVQIRIRDQIVFLTKEGDFFEGLGVLPPNAFEYKFSENRILILLNKIKNREQL